MRKLLDTMLVAALGVGTASSAILSDGLVRELNQNPDGTRRILVFFNDAPGAAFAMQGTSGDRQAGIEALRQNAALAQADFLREAGLGIDGVAVQSNWLANAIFMDATAEQIREIAARSDVKRVEDNTTIQLDPFITSEVSEGKAAPGDGDGSTWGLKAVKALEAVNTYAVDGTGVVAGVLDTGFDAAHPDLAGKLLKFKDFVGSNQNPYDDNGHGTHVSGTIGGGATSGMAIGVAPGVKFVAGKIFSGGGSAQADWILNGMQWIVDPDGQPGSGDEPRFVSNSWGGGPGATTFLEATKAWLQLGIAPIFAAGNSGPSSGSVGTPGGFLESLAVGATAVNTTIADFSSRGPVTWNGTQHIKPDVSAPGKDVTSAKAGGGYWTISGTSMATPHVAGMAALLYQANPDLTVDQLREVIEGTTVDHGPAGKDNDWGTGQIDCMAALAIVVSGGKVAGTVKDSDGNPVTHAQVTIVEKNVKIRLKDDGSFRMTLPEGSYTLATKAFGFTDDAGQAVSVTAGNETQVDIVLAKAASGTVAGVMKGAGAPVKGSVQVLDTPLSAVTVGEDGAFSVSLPAGSYKLMGRAYGYEMTTSDTVTVTADQTTEISLDLADLPSVLLVDDDDGKPYEQFFQAALDGVTGGYKTVDYASLQAGFTGLELAQYETVIWFTGADYQGSLTSGDQAALAEYLDLGGRLLVTGQDIGYELKSSAFYGERLKAKWVKDAADSKQVAGEGLSFAIEGGDGANNQRYPDVVEALAGGEAFLKYGNGTVAGVRSTQGNAKVVYLAFGFEGIDSAANRKAVMDAALGYLAPSRSEFAARLDAVAARQPRSAAEADDLVEFTEAMQNVVAARVRSIHVDGDAGVTSIDRSARRAETFGRLFE